MNRVEILKTYKIYIGGAFPRTESGRYYTPLNSKGDPLGNLCLSSRKDVRNAVTAARKAFGSWSERSAFNRIYSTQNLIVLVTPSSVINNPINRKNDFFFRFRF